jgi:hypothetical protein
VRGGRYAFGTLVPEDFASGSKDFPVQLVANNRAPRGVLGLAGRRRPEPRLTC